MSKSEENNRNNYSIRFVRYLECKRAMKTHYVFVASWNWPHSTRQENKHAWFYNRITQITRTPHKKPNPQRKPYKLVLSLWQSPEIRSVEWYNGSGGNAKLPQEVVTGGNANRTVEEELPTITAKESREETGRATENQKPHSDIPDNRERLITQQKSETLRKSERLYQPGNNSFNLNMRRTNIVFSQCISCLIITDKTSNFVHKDQWWQWNLTNRNT